jgi:hypothetical protein
VDLNQFKCALLGSPLIKCESSLLQGKFYFGELLPTVEECDHNTSAVSFPSLHSHLYLAKWQ